MALGHYIAGVVFFNIGLGIDYEYPLRLLGCPARKSMRYASPYPYGI